MLLMKTDITHSCGHPRTVNLLGTDVRGERRRKAEWLATQPCPDCTRRQRQTERQQQNQAAAAQAHTAGWPTLTGTEKQVAWAQSIRAEKTEAFNAKGSALTDTAAARAGEMWAATVLARATTAEWWIDHRFDPPGRMLRELCTDEEKQHLQQIVKDGQR